MTLVRHRVGTILAFAAIAAVIAIAGALLQTERLGLNLLLAGVYLAGLAVGVELFGEGADAGLLGFDGNGEWEREKTGAVLVSRIVSDSHPAARC